MIGSPNDMEAMQYNDRETLFDGDFGISYTAKNLSVQAAAYNLKTNLRSDQTSTADYGMYYTAVSYSIRGEQFTVTPKAAYRIVKNFNSMFDVGTEVSTFQNQIKLLGMYHTTGSTTAGIGYLFHSNFQVLGLYNTASRGLRNYTTGTFELGFQMHVDKKK
jgi:hypothetical protein